MNQPNKLVTLSNNFLISFKDEKGKNRFIYITPEGDYLPAQFEINHGHAIDHREWVSLMGKVAKDKKLIATDDQLAKALAASKKRSEMLALKTMADRMEWVTGNIPRKKAA